MQITAYLRALAARGTERADNLTSGDDEPTAHDQQRAAYLRIAAAVWADTANAIDAGELWPADTAQLSVLLGAAREHALNGGYSSPSADVLVRHIDAHITGSPLVGTVDQDATTSL
ncbi:hypothetical protein ACFU0X_35315 [Streptomyces cellulosae]|uniref:Uncharacterized protein n=1 Tax=Streptomyces cellulosae TaxID=1968 RepID=A0ABW6JS42_STRCE